MTAIMLLFVLLWIGAPLIHLHHEHCEHGEHDEDERDHRFCTLFHNLSQQTAVEVPELILSTGELERIVLSTVERSREYTEDSRHIRGPPNSA